MSNTQSISGDTAGSINDLKQAGILNTKLYVPPLPVDYVPRTELLKKIHKHRHRPLLLVSAPAGYGKSLLLSSLIETDGIPAAWISLDERDNDLRVFLSYLTAAINRHFPQSLKLSSQLTEAVELPSVAMIAQTLINEMDDIDSEFMIVLDDYHKIESKQVHELIETIHRYPPQQLRLALLARKDPPLKLHDLRAHSQLTELRIKDLSFKPPEIIMLFQKSHGFSISDQDSKTISEKTEGWITGLRLTGLSITNSEDLKNLLESMEDDSLYTVSNFLLKEVLLQQPESVQEYLLRSSILDRFCAELLDELFFSDELSGSEISDGKTFLNWLEQSGMFVIPLDMQHHWFRYHHLFQDLLKTRLREKQATKDYENDHFRASVWFEQKGLIEESIQHTLETGDSERAVAIIERNRLTELDRDRWYTVQRWLDMLPAIEQEKPDVLFAKAWIEYERFQLEHIPPILDRITRFLKKETKKPELWGELYFFLGAVDFWAGNGESAKQHFTKAKKHMTRQKGLTWGLMELLHGLSRYITGEKDLAIQQLKKRIRESASNEGLYLSRLMAGLFFIYQLAGQLSRAREAAIKMHTVARHNHNKYTEVWGSYMQGSTFLQAHDLEKAVDHFATVAEQRYIFHIRAAVDALAALSLTRQLMHEPDAAADSLDQLVSFARDKGDPSYIAVADSCRARISLLKGDLPAAAMQWAESVDGSAVPMELFVFLEVPQITRARVLITQSSKKNLEKALESLNQLRHQSEKCYYTCQIIEIAVLQSLALKKLGQTEQALDILTEVVALAGPLGWNRPFIEAGPPITDLLEKLKSQKEGNYYAEMLLKALKGIKPGENAPIPEHHIKDSPAVKNPEPELLSQRELEIIRLLAQGLNNKEIAASLFLSAHTIKTHLYNIYQKWDVHSRTSLIAKARKLGIFSE